MMIDPEILEKLPEKSGVYLMKSSGGEVLYVGKAKNIKERVKQYFVPGRDGRAQVPFLTSKTKSIDTIVTSSEKEALLLENTLIKKEWPKYNVLLRDDKSFVALKVNVKHEWPMIELVRSKGEPKKDGLYFGPYPSAFSAKQTLELLRKIFPLRQCSDAVLNSRTRPCILHGMGRCMAPCVQLCTKEEYHSLVDRVIQFLKGGDKQVVQSLKKEMQRLSDELEFEKANAIKNILMHIEKTLEDQLVEKIHGKDMDALGVYREGDEGVIVRMLYRKGRLVSTRNYPFSKSAQEESELLASVILQSYDEGDDIPKEILIPSPVERQEDLSEILSGKRGSLVEIVLPIKGDKKAVLAIALENAKAQYRQLKDHKEINEKTLVEMKETFHLRSFPRRIECVDISNFQGSEIVGALVAFTDAEKYTPNYRRYKIKLAGTQDDYLSIYEVLQRRFKRAQEENNLPDLIIIDGGKGHLNIGLKVLKELNIVTVDMISLTKEEGRHDKGMTAERVFIPNVKDPIHLRTHSKLLFLLQKIRDEAHRFAITFMHKRKSKSQSTSILDSIAGIGPKKKRILLRHFGSVKRLSEASEEEIGKVSGINGKDASELFRYFKTHPSLFSCKKNAL